MAARSVVVELNQEYQPEDLDHLSKQIAATFECIRIHEANKIGEGGLCIAPTSASTQATSQDATVAGLDSEVAGACTSGAAVEVVSTDAGDTAKDVTVYGLDVAGDPQVEVIATDAANGTTPVAGTALWSAVWGGSMAAAAGTVSITKTGAGANIITGIATGTLTKGIYATAITCLPYGPIDILADGASVKRVIIVGTDSADAAQMELVTLTGAVEVAALLAFKTVTLMITGEVEVARTLTARANSGATVWRINMSEIVAAVNELGFGLVAAADYVIHDTNLYPGTAEEGTGLEISMSAIATLVLKNVAGTITLAVVKGTPALHASVVAPTDAEITATVGADNTWIKVATCTIKRTGDTTVSQTQDNTVRPMLGVNTPYALGDL